MSKTTTSRKATKTVKHAATPVLTAKLRMADPNQHLRPMTARQAAAAAKADPDAQPLSRADLQRMKRTPRVKIIRQALHLSQDEFAERFLIPLGTLRDWEQGRVEPDQAARAYLRVIAREPEIVCKALLTPPARTP